MFDEMPRLRCDGRQPELAEAIMAVKATATVDMHGHLTRLSNAVRRRTALRPEAVTLVAIGEALHLLLTHMLDHQVFVCQHQAALQYLDVVTVN